MKLLLDIQDDKVSFFMELLKNFKYVTAKPFVDKNVAETDFWEGLPENAQKGIERAQKQVKSGQTTPHAQVMKKYARYL